MATDLQWYQNLHESFEVFKLKVAKVIWQINVGTIVKPLEK